MKIVYSVIVAILLIACAVGAWFFLKPSATDKLFEQCKEKVLSQLKAPSTAVFGEYTHTERTPLPFDIKGIFYDEEKFIFDLDAQNAFGALIRKKWECTFNYDGDKLKWVSAEDISE